MTLQETQKQLDRLTLRIIREKNEQDAKIRDLDKKLGMLLGLAREIKQNREYMQTIVKDVDLMEELIDKKADKTTNKVIKEETNIIGKIINLFK